MDGWFLFTSAQNKTKVWNKVLRNIYVAIETVL